MPTYDWQCVTCEKGMEAYVHSFQDEFICAGCGEPMEKVWTRLGNKHFGASQYPYVTKNIDPDGRPIEVTDAAHERALMNQFGLTKRDDAAWIEKEYLGWDMRRKQHRYREGSGAGLPGCWV